MKHTKNEAPERKKKSKFCIQSGCSAFAVAHGYCRLHYIANWKHIKFNRHVKAERRLNAYVDGLVKKYPKDFLEKIKEGLESEEKFKETVEELDSDPENEAKETEKEFLEKFSRTFKIGS